MLGVIVCSPSTATTITDCAVAFLHLFLLLLLLPFLFPGLLLLLQLLLLCAGAGAVLLLLVLALLSCYSCGILLPLLLFPPPSSSAAALKIQICYTSPTILETCFVSSPKRRQTLRRLSAALHARAASSVQDSVTGRTSCLTESVV